MLKIAFRTREEVKLSFPYKVEYLKLTFIWASSLIDKLQHAQLTEVFSCKMFAL